MEKITSSNLMINLNLNDKKESKDVEKNKKKIEKMMKMLKN